MLRIAVLTGGRHHDRGDGAQPRDSLSCLVEPPHMRVAGGEIAIRERLAGILLDREEEFRHGLVEAPSEKMRAAYCEERLADAGAGTEPQRGLDMLDRDVRLARPDPEAAADVPAARIVRVERQGAVDQRNHRADVLAE